MPQPKPTQPPGTKFIGSDGYWLVINEYGRLDREHRLIWEEAHGAIPPGYQIHHINHDRTDNRLENLECVDTVTHKRLHVGHRWIDGVWFKTCSKCGWVGPDSAYPTKKIVDGVRHTRGNCRPCDRARVQELNKRRRMQ
ncbi:HNH endonuclease signature motif containing protein [Roseovarius sp. S4756]|uniref:HNH endonuclease signature motif containing protein n=1 Tax=Roseovarius maritimus TaxID=3342637 RepID=UPI0037297C53